jgi:hypothetical protein
VAAAPLFLQILLCLALEVTLALILSLSSLQGTLHLDRTLAALPDPTAVPSKVHIAACFGATERVVAVLALVISCVGFLATTSQWSTGLVDSFHASSFAGAALEAISTPHWRNCM